MKPYFDFECPIGLIIPVLYVCRDETVSDLGNYNLRKYNKCQNKCLLMQRMRKKRALWYWKTGDKTNSTLILQPKNKLKEIFI